MSSPESQQHKIFDHINEAASPKNLPKIVFGGIFLCLTITAFIERKREAKILRKLMQPLPPTSEEPKYKRQSGD